MNVGVYALQEPDRFLPGSTLLLPRPATNRSLLLPHCVCACQSLLSRTFSGGL